MSLVHWYLLIAAGLWGIGCYGLIRGPELLRRVIALNLMGAAVFLVMVTLAARTEPADGVLHALVLTGLVVAVSATAFALALVARTLSESA
ncbi:NADH-quinone oxidoreductase subunit K [Alkalimonas amylolytica]|uniref:Multicomponent Na+:H+ antiporter subunit C n=1 Tax=Alkalimonas amylolytica TaxID=152573 RepID=A0A1H3XE30_ALKAM|nr:NADH-quinone oxidoreductase subunit K [Alkalimonas amylolytica]SDZ97599.1 multicomponent Na+:H+ antiporter subunit C [Alkalimonas amylolytica]